MDSNLNGPYHISCSCMYNDLYISLLLTDCNWQVVLTIRYNINDDPLANNKYNHEGPDSIQRCHFTSIENPTVEIRRS